MSDERPRYAHWRFPFASISGNKILLIEFFEARHWKLKYGMKVFPSLNVMKSVNCNLMFRLRIDGKWFGPKNFSFYTLVDAAKIVTELLEG